MKICVYDQNSSGGLDVMPPVGPGPAPAPAPGEAGAAAALAPRSPPGAQPPLLAPRLRTRSYGSGRGCT